MCVRESIHVFECVCVRERERESIFVCVRESIHVFECVCVCV